MPTRTLQTDIRAFLYDRTETIFPEKESKTCASLSTETERIRQGLERLLAENPEARTALLKLIDSYGELTAEYNRYFYNKGFTDGIRTIMLSLIGVE